ncbi:MAG: serine hydrolase, partial [Myxococcota bacterium]
PRDVPAADWATAAPLHPEARDALEAYLFPPEVDRADPERPGVRTDGFVVVHHGAVIYERYADGYDASARHLAWSVTKTFTNALTGIAVRDGLLSLDDSICAHLSGVPEASCAVRVRDLLEFASGWDWHETYEGGGLRTSSVLAMLYGEGQPDMATFVAGHPLRDPPGATWMYSSGDTNVLSAVVGRALRPTYGERFPWRALLDPIGAGGAVWERDGAGTYVGSSYLWATPRDLARFGLLWLDDGCWGGARVLPEGWVAASTAVNEPIRRRALARDPGDVQGRQVWLNQRLPEQGQDTLPWPDVPEGSYAAQGHWGQFVAVIPAHDLVVVRTADDRDGTFDRNRALALAIGLVSR